VLTLLLCAFALRRASLHEAAAFGPVLVAIVLSPMNYYLHCLFLVALLGGETKRAPWLIGLAMCAACWFTGFTADFHQHFIEESWVVVGASRCWSHSVCRYATRSPRSREVSGLTAPIGSPRRSSTSSRDFAAPSLPPEHLLHPAPETAGALLQLFARASLRPSSPPRPRCRGAWRSHRW